MKKIFAVCAAVIAMSVSACHSISSMPNTTIVYSEPVLINATSVVVGSGLDYAEARNSAIKKAVTEGWTRILGETVGIHSISGLVNVSLIVTK